MRFRGLGLGATPDELAPHIPRRLLFGSLGRGLRDAGKAKNVLVQRGPFPEGFSPHCAVRLSCPALPSPRTKQDNVVHSHAVFELVG